MHVHFVLKASRKRAFSRGGTAGSSLRSSWLSLYTTIVLPGCTFTTPGKFAKRGKSQSAGNRKARRAVGRPEARGAPVAVFPAHAPEHLVAREEGEVYAAVPRGLDAARCPAAIALYERNSRFTNGRFAGGGAAAARAGGASIVACALVRWREYGNISK